MYARLSEHYCENGISAINFRCPYYSVCSQKYPETFTTSKESFISSGYIKHELPRLVFVSLDSGSAENDPKLKTLEAVREWEQEHQNIFTVERNKHWYRTHELAHSILRYYKKGLNLEDARNYFAHVNSAKCCENKPGRGQARPILFNNCRQFLPGELAILDPDIIITQGKWARLAVDGAFKELCCPDFIPDDLDEIRIIEINNHPTIWITTFHPRHGNFYKFNKSNYPRYELAIQQFTSTQSTNIFIPKLEEHIAVEPEELLQKNDLNDINFYRESERKTEKVANKKVTGYIELDEYPDAPPAKVPAKSDCVGYKYLSMVQLCKIAQAKGHGSSRACNAFGGDNGDKPVQMDRQAWKWYKGGKIIKKFVLISAVEDYFREVGIDWH